LSGTVGATTLSTSQIPSHTHSGPRGDQSWNSGGGWNWWGNNTTNATGATGGSGSHDHSFSGSGSFSGTAHNHSFTGTAINMAVQYVDAIIAVKD